MTEVELVARAICRARQPMTDPDQLAVLPRGQLGQGPHWQVFYEQAARAAIKALDEARAGSTGAHHPTDTDGEALGADPSTDPSRV